jgi:hypothetical protein
VKYLGSYESIRFIRSAEFYVGAKNGCEPRADNTTVRENGNVNWPVGTVFSVHKGN